MAKDIYDGCRCAFLDVSGARHAFVWPGEDARRSINKSGAPLCDSYVRFIFTTEAERAFFSSTRLVGVTHR